MVNEERGEVLIVIGGQQQTVRLGFGGVKALEKAVGKSALWIMQNVHREASVELVIAALLIALRGTQHSPGPVPGLQEQLLLEWMDKEAHRFEEWSGAVGRMLALTLRGRKLKEDEQRALEEAAKAGPTPPAPTQEPAPMLSTGSDS